MSKRQFLIYTFSGLLLSYLIAYLCFTVTPRQSQVSISVTSKRATKSRKYTNNKQHILHFSPDTTTYFDFPWYQTAHTRPQYKPNATLLTTHLSYQERQKLISVAIQRAKKLALKRFPPDDYQGIRGTPLSSKEMAQQLRATMDCWTQGTWIEDQDAYQLTHIQDPTYTCHHKTTSVYRWQPNYRKSCLQLKPVDIHTWCRMLNGRNILIAGDLPHYQYHEVLLDAFRDQPTVCFGELNCKDHTICKTPKETMLRYIRNDLLSTHRAFPHKEQPLANIVQWPFVTSNVLTLYPIVILTRKSVLNDDDASFTRRLVQTMKVIRETSPHALVMYKSSFIGHPFCSDAMSPLKTSLSDEALKHLPFGWSETKRRNAIAKVVVEAAGGLYLDFASLVDTRPDAHVEKNQDCVRYCIPGPLDATVQILYNLFSLL